LGPTGSTGAGGTPKSFYRIEAGMHSLYSTNSRFTNIRKLISFTSLINIKMHVSALVVDLCLFGAK